MIVGMGMGEWERPAPRSFRNLRAIRGHTAQCATPRAHLVHTRTLLGSK